MKGDGRTPGLRIEFLPEGVADGIVLLLAAGVRARSGLGLGSAFGIGLPVVLGAGELLSEF